MSDSTGKLENKDLELKAQQDQETLDSGDGTVLGMKALELISAGIDSTSDEMVLYGIKRVEGEMRQTARDAYRKEHPNAHPDDVENAIKGSFATIGLEGKSGA
jgi:hypothetical protein